MNPPFGFNTGFLMNYALVHYGGAPPLLLRASLTDPSGGERNAAFDPIYDFFELDNHVGYILPNYYFSLLLRNPAVCGWRLMLADQIAGSQHPKKSSSLLEMCLVIWSHIHQILCTLDMTTLLMCFGNLTLASQY